MLYNKLKNNIVSKKEYTRLINRINKRNNIWSIF